MLRTEVTLWDRLARVAAERCRGAAAAILVSWSGEPVLFGRFDPHDKISLLNGIIVARGKRHDVMIPVHRATLIVVDPTRGLLDDLDDVAQWISDELASTGVRDFDLRERALQSTSEGIVVADALAPDVPVIYANRAFEQLTGYSAAEVLGRNCRFLQGEGTDPVQVEIVRTALREQHACRVELLNYRKDGRPFWNELSIAPVRDGMGVVTHFVGVQKDITDQKYTERALRESEARYATLFDNTAIGIYRSMPETGRIFMANRASATMLGYDSPEELVEANAILERPHPTYPREHFQRVMERDGVIANLQAPWLKKDGSLVFIRENCRSVVDPEGTLLYYEGTIEEVGGARDVGAEARPASLISAASSSDGVMAIDNSGRIVTFNREFVDLWKIPAELLHGRQDELIMTFMLDQLVEPIEFLFDDDRGVPVRRFAMRDGRVMERVSQRQFVHQEEAGWVWSFRDVTEASEAERRLRRSALERRAVMDTVPDIIFTLDPSGNVVDWNREFEEVLLGAGELPHGSVLELFPPGSRPAIVQLFDWALDNATARVDCIIERDGQSMIYEWLAAMLPGEAGEMAGLICTGRDITERKRAAEALADAAATWRRTFDAINFPVIVASRDGAIRRANDAARVLFAVSFDQLITTNLRDYGVEPWQTAAQLIDKALQSGTMASAQARNARPHVGPRVSAVRPEPDAPAMVVARDITRLSELQESLRRSERPRGDGIADRRCRARSPQSAVRDLRNIRCVRSGVRRLGDHRRVPGHVPPRRRADEAADERAPRIRQTVHARPARARVADVVEEGVRVVAAVPRKNIGVDVRDRTRSPHRRRRSRSHGAGVQEHPRERGSTSRRSRGGYVAPRKRSRMRGGGCRSPCAIRSGLRRERHPPPLRAVLHPPRRRHRPRPAARAAHRRRARRLVIASNAERGGAVLRIRLPERRATARAIGCCSSTTSPAIALRRPALPQVAGFDVEDADDRAPWRRRRSARTVPTSSILDLPTARRHRARLLLQAFRAIDDAPVVVLTAHASIDLAVDGGEGRRRALPHQAGRAADAAGRSSSACSRTSARSSRQLARDERRVARCELDPFAGHERRHPRSSRGRAETRAPRGQSGAAPGETGTGKSVLARWLHEHGRARRRSVRRPQLRRPRRASSSRPSCSATRRARSPARVAAKQGLLEVAHRGTLFLDEIGDMDLQVQPKLLKVLEEKRFRRLGDVRDRQRRRAPDRRHASRPRERLAAKGAFARISTSGSARSRSCGAAAARAARRHPAPRAHVSSASSRATSGSSASTLDARRRARARWTTRGPATSASCATSSSARCSIHPTALCAPRRSCSPRARPPRPPPASAARSKTSSGSTSNRCSPRRTATPTAPRNASESREAPCITS